MPAEKNLCAFSASVFLQICASIFEGGLLNTATLRRAGRPCHKTNEKENIMTTIRFALTSAALAISVAAGFAQSIPAALEVPPGNVPYLKTTAEGTQNYICLPTATGFAWTFFGPQATLFVKLRWFQGDVPQQLTTHYLSTNPQEGVNRPTWQSSLDTSAVWGRAAASSSDPAFVQPGAIPWLLVQIVGSRPGPTGGKMLADTTFIHRVNTAGGVTPATGCSQPSNVGATALVPYTTDYIFYRAAR